MSNLWTKATVGGFVVVALWSTTTAVVKASEGRSAFVRWMGDTERLLEGEAVYLREGDGDEGYPNLPLMALLLVPFHALGAVPGALLWALVRIAIAVWIYLTVLRFARGRGPPWPGWARFLLMALSMGVFALEMTHANVNLLVAGTVVGALALTEAGRPLLAGLAIGLGAVLKVTPALFLLYFAWKGRWRAVAGVLAGVAVFALLVPGLVLGFERNAELVGRWHEQMIQPFVAGREAGERSVTHPNQSLCALGFRLLSATPAVEPDPRRGRDEPAYVNLVDLDDAVVTWVVRAAYVLLLGLLAFACRVPRDRPANPAVVGEFGLVFLAMLLISERSWKHHYVLLILAHALLLFWLVRLRPRGLARAVPWVALVGSALLQHTFHAALFGRLGAHLAQAYGTYLWSAVLLFAACAFVLHRLRARGWPDPESAGSGYGTGRKP